MALSSSTCKAPNSMALRTFLLSSPHTETLYARRILPSFLVILPRRSLTRSTLVFSRRRNYNSAGSSSPSKKKKNGFSGKEVSEEGEEEDLTLFGMLEEDLKNDRQFQLELEEVLGFGGDDEEDYDDVEEDDEEDEEEEEEDEEEEEEEEEEDEERPVQLKNWQFRRLASALKVGRRKTSIKSLATELCLDRAVILEMLRNPPPKLVLLSAALPDEPPPKPLLPEIKPIKTVPLEETTLDAAKSEGEKNEPVHVLRHRWSDQKRMKKVQLQTLEMIYRRTKRPTNAMISSIVEVTSLPRKRVVKWFEDKRNEDGVPQHRTPYQRSVQETVFSP